MKDLGAETLILAGFTADTCVLFTANDAFVRDYQLIIPSDCVASQDEKGNERALKFMQRILKADVSPSTETDLTTLARISKS